MGGFHLIGLFFVHRLLGDMKPLVAGESAAV